MPSLIDCKAELVIFTQNNWVSTPYKLPDFPFDDNGVDKWIEVAFAPIDNQIIGYGDGVGRINYKGNFIVWCRAERLDNCYILADEVVSVFANKSLPLNIEIGIPQFSPIRDLESELYELKVSFEVNQN